MGGRQNGGADANARPAGDSNSLSKSALPDGSAPNGSSLTSSSGTPSAPSLIPTFGAPPSENSGQPGNPSRGAGQVPSSEPEDAEPQLGSSSGLSRLGGEREKKAGPTTPVRRYIRRDWNIFVECKADEVIIYPGGSRIPVNSLGGHGNTLNQSLLQAIQQMIARRQAMSASSESPQDASASSPQIRFLVRPEGLRTYFLAYPELESLHLPMSRENLDANEDVLRRVLGR
jgi:hypothetical protein